MAVDVFISHHTASSLALVRQICDRLEMKGLTCWYAPRDTRQFYAHDISGAIREAKVFVLMLNEESSCSKDVLNEVELAFQRVRADENIFIVPFQMDASCKISEDAKYYISRTHWMDAMIRYGKVFLEGIGGIGKSQIVRQFIRSRKNEYGSVLFMTFCNTLMDTINNADVISGFERMPDEEPRSCFLRKLKLLKSLSGEKTLIVVDNFDVDMDDDLELFLDAEYSVIFTTRNNHEDTLAPAGGIDFQLFVELCGLDDCISLDELIRQSWIMYDDCEDTVMLHPLIA